MQKNPKSKRMDAERASEHYAHSLGCIVTCRAVRTQWQRQDLFASDVIGKKADGRMVFIQATAGQNSAVTARRRKLEKIPWHYDDLILICQLVQEKDPDNKRRKNWYFRIHRFHPFLSGGSRWSTYDFDTPIKKEWFKAYKEV